MNVATETAMRVHHLRAMNSSFDRHIGRVSFVTPMTEPNERM
jgi:hypothetical protein